eukprot:29075-Chlamydomonas_euryale.AAC.2
MHTSKGCKRPPFGLLFACAICDPQSAVAFQLHDVDDPHHAFTHVLTWGCTWVAIAHRHLFPPRPRPTSTYVALGGGRGPQQAAMQNSNDMMWRNGSGICIRSPDIVCVQAVDERRR